MSGKPAKQPQDHKRKAVDQLQAEASKVPGIAETENRRLTVEGRNGVVTVSTLPMLEWDAEVPGLLRENDYFGAICGMISPNDAALLRASRPTLGAIMTAIYAPDEESGEASLGEPHAS